MHYSGGEEAGPALGRRGSRLDAQWLFSGACLAAGRLGRVGVNPRGSGVTPASFSEV